MLTKDTHYMKQNDQHPKVKALQDALDMMIDDMEEAHVEELISNHQGDGPDCSYCRNIAHAKAVLLTSRSL